MESTSWLQASSKTTQRIDQTDVGQVVLLDIVDGAEDVSLDTDTGAITIQHDAHYLVVSAPQVGRTSSGGTANFRCWLRVNGTNVPDSNVLLSLPSQDVKDVIVAQVVVHLSPGDVLEVIMATDNSDAGVGIEAIQPTPDEPLVPAIIFSLDAR
jgi:hypothetical protein